MKFRKAILRTGKYLATSGNGERIQSEFSPERLAKMATTANSMIQAGLKIPAPFSHNKQALPKLSTDSTPDPYINGGYWDKFWVEQENGVTTLFGTIDAEGDVNDLSTPAGKLSKTIQECSVSIRPEFTDGKGIKWVNDPIIHVALCTHPVDYSTGNFELADAADFTVSLSTHLASEDDISVLRTRLREVVQIHLPEECSSKNLVSYLLNSLGQLELTKKEGANPDDGYVIEPSPVFLSTEVDMPFTQQQAQALVDSKVPNPATGKPYTMDDFGFKVKPAAPTTDHSLDANIESLQQFSKAVTAKLVSDQKANLTRRANVLLDTKRITKEYMEKTLLPQIAEISLNFSNGEITKPNIESLVEALEAIPVPTTKPAPTTSYSLPTGATVHEPDDSSNQELSDEDANKLAEQMLNYI